MNAEGNNQMKNMFIKNVTEYESTINSNIVMKLY